MTDSQALPPKLESTLINQLTQLTECGHRADELARRTTLPRAYRNLLFYFLGFTAKGSGRVTEADITYAQCLMKALGLSARQRKCAIHHFQKGKATEHLPLQRGLWLRWQTPLRPGAAVTTAICLCHGAQVPGQPAKSRRYRCEDSLIRLGLPVAMADEIFEHYASKVWAQSPSAREKPVTYEQACRVLGVTRRDSLEDIKRHYRKKVSACHPDKLAQQKLTPSERAMAKDQLLNYQVAWELIKKRHNLANR